MHVYLIDAWRERAMLGGRRKLKVSAFMSVREVKCALSRLLGIPVSRQRLYWRSRELKDGRTLEESGIEASGATLVFDARPADSSVGGGEECLLGRLTPAAGEKAAGRGSRSERREWSSRRTPSLEPISCAALHGGAALPAALNRALLKARRALVVGAKAPELALDGTGGTYFLRSLDGRPAACFKPADEEPFCANNPRHFVGGETAGLSMRRGVRPGEAYLREVAAYLLDARGGGLAGVPETTVVECRHPKFQYADREVRDKVGSLQVFVEHDGVAEDYGVDRLETARLQAVAALDVRALNCDRNSANLLVPRRGERLAVVPIDHGFCLPEVLEIEWFDWCWIDWPQLAAPVCDEVKKALAASDPAADAAALRDALGLRPKCLRLARAAAELLKRGVAAGLTLRDVASLVVAPQRDPGTHFHKSRLAAAIDRAADLAALALDEDRHPGRRKRPASPHDDRLAPRDEAKRQAPKQQILVSSAQTKALELHLSFGPVATAREDKNVAELQRRVAAAARHDRSWPLASSPRWVDGLPADVASRMCRDLSPVADELDHLQDDDDHKDDHQDDDPDDAPPPRRRRPTAPPDRARRHSTPLVRLHSCPALADVLSSEDDPPPRAANRDEPSARPDPNDDHEFDRHFFHFLVGILDDLVKWKQLATTKATAQKKLASF